MHTRTGPLSWSVSGETRWFREIPGQQVPFVPISDTLFKLGPVFTAEFVIDQAGDVTQILTDGIDIEFRLRRKTSGKAAAPPPPSPEATRRWRRSSWSTRTAG